MNDIMIIREDEEGNREAVKLTGVPDSDWEKFAARCGKHLETDDDKSAWGKVFAAVIQSEFLTKDVVIPYIKTQKADEYVFLLAGIPLQARDNLEMAASQANLTPDLLVALLYDSAMREQLHILSLKPVEGHDGNHVIFVSGVTSETWSAWGEASKKLKEVTGEDVRPDNFLGFLLEKALWGQISITTDDPGLNELSHQKINKSYEEESVKANQNSHDEMVRLKAQVDAMVSKMQSEMESKNANQNS